MGFEILLGIFTAIVAGVAYFVNDLLKKRDELKGLVSSQLYMI